MLNMKNIMKQKAEEKLGSVKMLENQIKEMLKDFQKKIETQELVFQDQLQLIQSRNNSGKNPKTKSPCGIYSIYVEPVHIKHRGPQQR